MIDTVPQLLDEARARFITDRVAIIAGSRNAENLPSVVRAYGCRVAPDYRQVTIFVARDHSSALLEDLRAGNGIAVVFTRPSTHETLQLKSPQVRIGPLAADDRERMRAYGRMFREELGTLGCQDPFLEAMIAPVELDALAVTFAPVAAFEQTPGPNAGQPLGVRT